MFIKNLFSRRKFIVSSLFAALTASMAIRTKIVADEYIASFLQGQRQKIDPIGMERLAKLVARTEFGKFIDPHFNLINGFDSVPDYFSAADLSVRDLAGILPEAVLQRAREAKFIYLNGISDSVKAHVDKWPQVVIIPLFTNAQAIEWHETDLGAVTSLSTGYAHCLRSDVFHRIAISRGAKMLYLGISLEAVKA